VKKLGVWEKKYIFAQYYSKKNGKGFISSSSKGCLRERRLDRLQEYPFLLHLIEKHNLKLLVYDELQKEVIEWKR
jgi:hypothetical protein